MHLSGIGLVASVLVSIIIIGGTILGIANAVLRSVFVTKTQHEGDMKDCQSEICTKLDALKVSVDGYTKVHADNNKEYARDKKIIAVALTKIAGKMDIEVEVP